MRWNQLNFAAGSAMPAFILLYSLGSTMSRPWSDWRVRWLAESRERYLPRPQPHSVLARWVAGKAA